jgi:hypothetical protein
MARFDGGLAGRPRGRSTRATIRVRHHREAFPRARPHASIAGYCISRLGPTEPLVRGQAYDTLA